MKTLLLLAGRSRRFWPLADKALFPLCGKTLLEHQVARLKDAGCEDITLVGGSHNLAAASALFPGMPTIQEGDDGGGMHGAMGSALPEIGDELVMVVSSNDVIDPSGYRQLLEAAGKEGTDGALLASKVTRHFPGGYLKISGGVVERIVEKPAPGEEPSDLVNIVAHVHDDPAAFLNALREASTDKDDGYEVALSAMFQTHAYKAIAYSGLWQPVKYPWHLLSLLPHLFEQGATPRIHASAQVHPTAVVEGNVVIGPRAKVMPHASVIGPASIGEGTVIGNNVLVREASIGDHCVIGFGGEVKTSVLADHVWTHMTYIGDSVIGENVSFGAGCITGNLRLDEDEISSEVSGAKTQTSLRKFGTAIGDHCRIGIRVGINPGVKIGGGSFVAGGSMLSQDIPDGSFVKAEHATLSIRPNKNPVPRRS